MNFCLLHLTLEERINMAHLKSIIVRVDEKHGVEKCLKKFKRLCEAYGVIREYRKRQEYKKPSVRTKEKMAAAEKRRNKAAMKMFRNTKI